MADEATNGPERQDYVVSDRAGRRVAGRVVKAGDILSLTAHEAEYELREGTLVAKPEEPKPADAPKPPAPVAAAPAAQPPAQPAKAAQPAAASTAGPASKAV